jgi:hypothetical protein
MAFPSLLESEMRWAWAVGFALVALGGNSALAVNTFKDQKAFVGPFGCQATATFGQVITVPQNKHYLDKFGFILANYSLSASMVVRGEVYGWDGEKATGAALYESRPRRLFYTDNNLHREIFKPIALPLAPGAQYVLFLSVSKDTDKCPQRDNNLYWGATDDSTYSGGTFVATNNPNWTGVQWIQGTGYDLAFKADLSP